MKSTPQFKGSEVPSCKVGFLPVATVKDGTVFNTSVCMCQQT